MTGLLKVLSDLPEKERLLVYSLFQSEKRNTRPPLSLIKQIEQIGLLHEARLLSTKLDEKAENQNVKSLLLQLLHSVEPIKATAKTQAETVLNKITGLQLTMLQSQENVQQVQLQLPVIFGTQAADLSIRWEGKQTGSGEIDSVYCRILFILQLENMKETTVAVNSTVSYLCRSGAERTARR
ncbi:hypothetical protein [Fictibacillus terranigra]|uniref:Uncharacterized protein n=1 Tax=Fictibacillus terranigra TaxID=3058424 RepID=A0ABT8E6B7_9BACL|nr:hypothetical protein [Fictibacillus sp. CENA-BCM004]MDN4073457.1 hypothetical protein [Fictibacillus sp. CENA-BCM004]